MPSTRFLIQLKQLYSEKDSQVIVSSLRQDPLVWAALQQPDFCDKSFLMAGSQVTGWQPARLALLSQNLDHLASDLTSIPLKPLDPEIRQKAFQYFEKTLGQPTPPVSLEEAGWLALALRERRRVTNTWQGLWAELANHGSENQPGFKEVWRTPLACLFGLASDSAELLQGILDPPTKNRSIQIYLVLHVLLSNPLSVDDQLGFLSYLLANIPPSEQLEWLATLNASGRFALLKALSRELLQSRQNVVYFSQLPVPVAALQNPDESKIVSLGSLFQGDPLEAVESTRKIEAMEHLAAFFRYAGANSQALPVLTGAWEAARRLQARLTSQLAELAEEDQDHVTAMTAWEQVVQLAPDSPLARARLSSCLAKADRRQDALAILPETFTSPQQLTTPPPAIHLVRASLVANLGDHPQAQAHARQAIESIKSRATTARPNAGVVETLLNLEMPREAVQIALSALEDCRADAELIGLLAQAQLKAGQMADGVESAYLAVILDPANQNRRRLLAGALEAFGENEQALVERQYIVNHSHPPTNPDLLALAGAALKAGHLEDVPAICEEVLANNPEEGLAHALLGEVLSKTGKPEEAIEHFVQATLLVPDQSYPWMALSRAQNAAGDTKKALETLRSAAQANPKSAEILLALGEACLANGCPSDALVPLRTAYNLQPQSLPVITRLADTLFALGHFKEARQVLDAGRQQWPEDPNLAFLRGQTLLALGEKQAALPDLLAGAQAASAGIEPCIILARTVLELLDSVLQEASASQVTSITHDFDLSNVLAALIQALNSDPANIEARLLLAEIYKASRQYPEAMEMYLQLSEAWTDRNSPWHWRIQFGLGQVAKALDQNDIAVASLQEAAAARPENLSIQHALAEALSNARLASEAMQTARFAQRMAPHDLSNLIWFARLAQSLDYQSDVINVLERAVQIDPERSDLLLWLGQTQLQAGNLSAAHQVLKRLISFPQTTPEELHQAALTYIRMEDYASAAAMLETAHQKAASPSFELLFDLALIYDHTGNPANALDMIQQAKTIQPDDPRGWIEQADLLSRLERPQAALAGLEHGLQLAEARQEKSQASLEAFSPLVRKIDADPASIHARLSRLQRTLGELAGALEHAEKAATLAPEYPDYRYLAVDLAYSVFETDRARSWIDDAAIEKALTHPDFHSQIPAVTGLLAAQAELALEQGDTDQASTAISKALHFAASHPRIAAAQARLALRSGERLAAGQFLAQAVQAQKQVQTSTANTNSSEPTLYKNSRDLWAALAVADACMDLDHWQEAYNLYQQAIAANPLEPRPQLLFARALILCAETQYIYKKLKVTTHAFNDSEPQETRYDQFEQAITAANQRCSSNEVGHWRNRGEAVFNPSPQTAKSLNRGLAGIEDVAALVITYGRINRITEAKKLGEAYPDSPEVQLKLAVALLDIEPETSLASAYLTAEKSPTNPLCHALLAFLMKSDPGAARQSIETALTHWPDELSWREYAAQVCEQMGDGSAAIAHWQQLARLKPDHAPYLVSLGDTYLNLNETTLAVQALEKAARLDPMQINTWLSLAKAYQQAGDLSQALDCADRAVIIDSAAPAGLLLSGQIALQLGKTDLALQRGQAVLNLDPGSANGVLLYARALDRSGQSGDALATIEKILPDIHDALPVQIERARLVREVRGSQAALPYLKDLARTNPESPEVLTSLAEALADTGQYQAAEDTAQAALQLDPSQAPLYLLLGRLERSKGQLDQAIHHLSDAIRLSPSAVDAYIELGRAYQDRREHLQALRIYRQANQVAPDDSRAYYQAGLVLRESKDYLGAEAMLRQAAKLAPDDVGIRRQLGAIIALNLVHHRQEVL